MKRLRDYAQVAGRDMVVIEGANHTKITIGDRHTTVPRHSEINEMTARGILKHMGVQP